MNHKPQILFFSTGNATRSRMAEAFLRRFAGDHLEAKSTAVASTDASPLGMEVMHEVGIDLSEEQAAPVVESLKEHFACVVTLSDDAKERSPVWPFTPRLFHWNLMDPAVIEGPKDQRKEAFRRVRDEIQRQVRQLADGFGRELVAVTR